MPVIHLCYCTGACNTPVLLYVVCRVCNVAALTVRVTGIGMCTSNVAVEHWNSVECRSPVVKW